MQGSGCSVPDPVLKAVLAASMLRDEVTVYKHGQTQPGLPLTRGDWARSGHPTHWVLGLQHMNMVGEGGT